MKRMSENRLQHLSKAVIDLDVNAVKEYTLKALNANIPPQEIIRDGLSIGMERVGDKFARGEYFLSELIWGGQIMKEAMAILEPHLRGEKKIAMGTVVIATVEGDLHDIGKNIAISMLQSAGFQVIDLGVDVSADVIVEKAIETKAEIIALSALLSFVEPYLTKTIHTIRESSIGGKVKILVGGRIVDAETAKEMGADAYAKDAWDGIAKAKELLLTS